MYVNALYVKYVIKIERFLYLNINRAKQSVITVRREWKYAFTNFVS